ncbi:YfcC family protein [Enterococcus canintestini]|uniref:Arginine:ornithine antiporter n=1 Tax=Enterococcus canintestini TaxID=317010 RepID=A0A267HQQ4_9ENTE|nr:YfcC family protein [Enterococcus canintestini]PAB00582.1 arginine:ornithine antiporter [Enterococcus canintestini]
MENTHTKKKFQMPSAYTVLFIIIAFIAILTWFIPAGHYKVDDAGNILAGTYERVAQNPQGFYDVMMAPVLGMLGSETTDPAISISFFILIVGGFLGIVNKTGALDAGIGSIVKRFKGREKNLIFILLPIFALGGSTYGMAEETIPFYSLLIPVMMAVGFDSIVAVSIVLIGSQVGCLASTVNPFATGVASDAVGISMADGMLLRIIMWVVLVAISIAYVYRYAAKIEKDPTQSLVYNQREEDMKHFDIDAINRQEGVTKKQRNVNILFIVTFLLMILSLIPWEEFGINIFADFTKWLSGLPGLGMVLGKDMLPFGQWYFPEITMLFLLMSIVVAIVYGFKESEFISEFLTGASDLIGVAIVVAVARGIQVVMNNGMITDTILNWGEKGLSGLSSIVFIILTFVFYIPMSFLIPSTSGLAAATMGIIGPMGEFAGVGKDLVITAYQSASGLVNLITPTSAIVMGAVAIARIDIGKWWKYITKLIAILFVAICILLAIGTLL